MSPIPLLIDTDVALGVEHEGRPRDIDDGFAVVEAINVPDIELLGVTTVYGNAPHAAVHRVAKDIVALKAVDVPVVAGATEALPVAVNLHLVVLGTSMVTGLASIILPNHRGAVPTAR